MSDEPAAAQIIDALLDGGELVDEGSFSVDRGAAAAKMEAFRYADRVAYLIPIVEALHLLGARKINLTTRGPDLSLRAEGVVLREPADSLAGLYAHALGAPDPTALERGLGRLGVGVDMALGCEGVERIALSYSTSADMFVAEYRPREAPRITRREPEEPGELRLLVDRPWTSALSLSPPTRAELDVLSEAVRYSSRQIWLDRELLSQRSRVWLASTRGSGDGLRWEAGLAANDRPARVELWSAGVRVDSVDLAGYGFEAELHLDAPKRDLSQSRIVRDASVEAGLAALELARAQLEPRRPRPEPEPDPAPEPDEDPLLEPPVPLTAGSVLFYVAGIIAGAIGVSMVAAGRLIGLFVMIFLVTHACVIGARDIAKSLTRRGDRRGALTGVLAFVAVILAAILGQLATLPLP